MHIRDLRRKLLWGVFFGILVAAGLALWGDARALVEHLAAFDWRLAPLILALTLCNYGLRFLKWQWYLRIIAAALPWRRSLGIFVAGFPMVLTPGKVGELLKSFLLRASNGTPIARSAPVVLAERISDGPASSATRATACDQNALEGRRYGARFHIAGHGWQDVQVE